MTCDFEEILGFWLGDDLESPEALESRFELWFGRDEGFDQEIAARFGGLPSRAERGELRDWENAPRSALALILILDQFPRNLFRDSPRSFEFDHHARRVALTSIERSFDSLLHPLEAAFVYLPLEHAEDPALQERCVQLFARLVGRSPRSSRERFEGLLAYAKRHREVIRLFGRFPHRNDVLGRTSTPAEISYLDAGGESFGGSAAKSPRS